MYVQKPERIRGLFRRVGGREKVQAQPERNTDVVPEANVEERRDVSLGSSDIVTEDESSNASGSETVRDEA